MHFDLYPDRDAVLDYIEKKRSYTIAVTNLPAVYERYVGKYDKLKYTMIALGYHPELVTQYPDQMAKFEKLLDFTRYIGEIGLDYSIDDMTAREKQFTIFQEIVEKCTGKEKILSIHSRRAVSDVLKALEGFDGKIILHWYSGSIRDMETALGVKRQIISGGNGVLFSTISPLNGILFSVTAQSWRNKRHAIRRLIP